jgi:hypothetical protein
VPGSRTRSACASSSAPNGDQISIFCAHDVHEFEHISGRSHREPVPRAPARSVNVQSDMVLMTPTKVT